MCSNGHTLILCLIYFDDSKGYYGTSPSLVENGTQETFVPKYPQISLKIPKYPLLEIALTNTHTGLDNIHHIVGEFLALVHEVDVGRTFGIGVLVVVYVADILCL